MEEMTFDFTDVPAYSWGDLHYLDYELGLQLDSISVSISLHDKLIEEQRGRLREAIAKDEYLKSDEREEIKAQYETHYFGSQEEAINELEVVFHNSSFLSLFAIFEGKFKQLCEMIEDEMVSAIKHGDLRASNDIDRFSKYLKGVFSMQITAELKLNEIQKYKTVRNKIAHQNNRVKVEEIKRIQSLPGLKLEGPKGYQTVVISTAFFTPVLALIREFFKELIKDVDKRMQEVKKK